MMMMTTVSLASPNKRTPFIGDKHQLVINSVGIRCAAGSIVFR